MAERADRVLELKRQALAFKRDGDLDQAKRCLGEARQLELQGLNADDLDDPAALKKLALARKREGDLEGAKAALCKAKRLEAEAQAGQALSAPPPSRAAAPAENGLQPPPHEPAPKEPAPPVPNKTHHAESARKPSDGGQAADEELDEETDPDLLAEYAALHGGDGTSAEPTHDLDDIPVSGAGAQDDEEEEDPELLEQYLILEAGGALSDAHSGQDAPLSAADSEDECMSGSASVDGATVTLGKDPAMTDEELLDVEMVLELTQVGMALPADEVYEHRVQVYKTKALEHKRAGDLERAKAALRTAKEFEAALAQVRKARAQQDSGAQAELGTSDFGELAEDFAAAGGVAELTEEELMDPDLLAEMKAIGMVLPTPQSFLDRAKAAKVKAVQLKKAGRLDEAKQALRESKSLQSQAERLASVLGAGGDASPDPALEGLGADAAQENEHASFQRLLELAEGQANLAGEPRAPAGGKAMAVASKPAPVEPRKSAAELKLEAIELKKQNKLKEAAATFRSYKAALEVEQAQQAKQALADRRAELQEEFGLARDQERLFGFLALLGRKPLRSVGAEQRRRWGAYAGELLQAIAALDQSSAPLGGWLREQLPSARGLELLRSDLSFLEAHAAATDGDVEVAVVALRNLEENKAASSQAVPFQLTAEAVFQLPASEADPDGSISLQVPAPAGGACSRLDHVEWLGVARAAIPRGESKLARMVLRRMPRKKAVISIFGTQLEADSTSASRRGGGGGGGGLFSLPWGSRAPATAAPAPPVFLGKVGVELGALLNGTSIAGDFPLMDKALRRPVGGVLQFALRTGRPFDPHAAAPLPADAAPLDLAKFAGLDLDLKKV